MQSKEIGRAYVDAEETLNPKALQCKVSILLET